MIVVEYVELKNEVVGLVAAAGKHKVGWSICNPIEKKCLVGRGIEIALGRIKKYKYKMNRTPLIKLESILKDFIHEQNRTHNTKRYKELTKIIDRIGAVYNALNGLYVRSATIKF